MKIEHLRYFMDVVQSKSISQAAKNLYISQQQLNNILTALEQEMQVPLLNRTNKGVTLTEDGEIFVKYATKLLAEYSSMQKHFRMRQSISYSKPQYRQGQCTLHTTPAISVFSSDIINKFRDVAPNIDLHCVEDPGIITQEQLISGHLYLLGYHIEHYFSGDFNIATNSISLGDFESCIYVSKYCPIAQQKQINQKDMAQLITIASPFVPLEVCHQEKLKVYRPEKVSLNSSNVYQQLDNVSQNGGVCILPQFLFPKISSLYPDITMLPFEPSLITPLNIIYSPLYTISEADEILIAFLKSYMQNQNFFAKQFLP